MKYKVIGEARYEYDVEADNEGEAIEVALDQFHQITFQSWDDILEWEAKPIEEGG